MPYTRVTYEELEGRYQELLRDFQAATDGTACLEVLRRRSQLQADMTPIDLCYIRHDMNINDPFYAAEQSYYDEIGPRLSDLSSQLDRLIVTSPYRADMEAVVGSLAKTMMEEGLRSFDSRLIPLAQEENELRSQHNQLTSNTAVLWEGEQIKRTLMISLTQSSDRETRKRAPLAVSDSWEAQRSELENLYARLVDNRRRQAEVLGFAATQS